MYLQLMGNKGFIHFPFSRDAFVLRLKYVQYFCQDKEKNYQIVRKTASFLAL